MIKLQLLVILALTVMSVVLSRLMINPAPRSIQHWDFQAASKNCILASIDTAFEDKGKGISTDWLAGCLRMSFYEFKHAGFQIEDQTTMNDIVNAQILKAAKSVE